MSLSLYEQYLYYCRIWTTKYFLSLTEIENAALCFLLDMEILDSTIDAAFAKSEMKFIDDIL